MVVGAVTTTGAGVATTTGVGVVTTTGVGETTIITISAQVLEMDITTTPVVITQITIITDTTVREEMVPLKLEEHLFAQVVRKPIQLE